MGRSVQRSSASRVPSSRMLRQEHRLVDAVMSWPGFGHTRLGWVPRLPGKLHVHLWLVGIFCCHWKNRNNFSGKKKSLSNENPCKNMLFIALRYHKIEKVVNPGTQCSSFSPLTRNM